MSAEEKYDLFEDYLNDALTDAQRTDFEQRLREDEVLSNEFALFNEMRTAISSRMAWETSEKPFVQTLDALSKEHFRESKVVSFTRTRLFQMVSAAAVILLLVLVLQPWQKDLYSRFAQHPRAELTARDGSGTLPTGARAFNNKEYEVALDAFTQHLAKEPQDIEVRLYQGICYLELDRAEEAKHNFRELLKSSASKDIGAWYMGLSHLKQKNIDSTSWYLNQISEASEYYSKASRLLKKLE
jgi:tetratricopeptide (TPR) repeat protein